MHNVQRHCVFALLLGTITLHGCGSQPPELNKNEELAVACLTKPDPGPGRARETRFYYDYRDNRCKAFYYGGVKGRVPFQTVQECRDYCVAE
jgi:hypothetical protein